MSARPLQPAPKFLPSALRIMDLSIGEMLWSRRTVFMMLLVSTPVVMALFIRLLVGLGVPIFNHTTMNGAGIFGILIWLFYLRLIVPILGVFYGTSLIADEVEDKTITYLFTRPIPKGAVLVGKYLAYLVCTIFVVLPSVMLVYLLIAPMGTWCCSRSAWWCTARSSRSSGPSSSVRC
jgi:ABC-2 type transport system permease protein